MLVLMKIVTVFLCEVSKMFYFCSQSEQKTSIDVDSYTESYKLLTNKDYINQRGVVMLDETKHSMPNRGDYYVSHPAIVLCDHGFARFDYDFRPSELHTHDILILQPGHTIKALEASDDYKVRVIVISEDFFNKIKHLNIAHFNKYHGYNAVYPVCHLSDEHYSPISDAFNVLQAVSSMCKENREVMMLSIIHTIILMRHEFYPISEESNKQKDTSISARFQEAVVKHYRESRSVEFYAKMYGLSAKYFATLIKEGLYISPGRYINRYVAARAKELLDKRGDLNIQQVANELGFDEQSTFSRFFKGQVGMTPKEYRNIKETKENSI